MEPGQGAFDQGLPTSAFQGTSDFRLPTSERESGVGCQMGWIRASASVQVWDGSINPAGPGYPDIVSCLGIPARAAASEELQELRPDGANTQTSLLEKVNTEAGVG